MTIPRRFEDITPAWLTSTFRESGVLGAAAVSAVALEPIGVGVGFLGQLARLRLTYDRPEDGAPATVITKLPTLEPGGRGICQLFQFYEREIRFYRDLAREIPVRVPHCYASAMDAAADDYILLLEDLGDFPMGDDAKGCSAAEAETGCVEPAVRRAEEMRLLRLWYELATAGRAGRFSFADALVDYRRSVLYCNLYNVIAIGSLDAANVRGMALFTAWLRRRGAAIEELDAGELMP